MDIAVQRMHALKDPCPSMHVAHVLAYCTRLGAAQLCDNILTDHHQPSAKPCSSVAHLHRIDTCRDEVVIDFLIACCCHCSQLCCRV